MIDDDCYYIRLLLVVVVVVISGSSVKKQKQNFCPSLPLFLPKPSLLLSQPPSLPPWWRALPRTSVSCPCSEVVTDTNTHTREGERGRMKMAMRAALRCLNANFTPRVPRLVPAAQLPASLPLWRSVSPRTLSTTIPAWSSGNFRPPIKSAYAVDDLRGCCAVRCGAFHTFLRVWSPPDLLSLSPPSGAQECATEGALSIRSVTNEKLYACFWYCFLSLAFFRVTERNELSSVVPKIINERQSQITASRAARRNSFYS